MTKKVKKSSRKKQATNSYVLMADMIDSNSYDLKTLSIFKKKVDQINKDFQLLSPLTITLGDEFQSIPKSLYQAIEIIFQLEFELIKENSPFKLRYALGYGSMLTSINNEIAHGMYGEALTYTRLLLESTKNNRERFIFNLPNKNVQTILNNLFHVYQSIVDDWKQKDYELITLFHKTKDYKQVAKMLDKKNDQIWRREKSLKIREFFKLKHGIRAIVDLLNE